MCMGLAMAGACAKHWPCYWSQTSLLLTKNSKKSLYLNFTLALLALHFNILPLDFSLLLVLENEMSVTEQFVA